MPTAGSFGSKRAAAITVSATDTLRVEVEDAVYRRKRASRPYRSSYPEAESVEPDIGMALGADGRPH
jgi:hypothetical protein